MINFCWFFFKWGLVLCVIGAVAAVPYFYRRVDEELRRRIEARFAQHYAGLKVTVGSAELVTGQGIKVRDLAIMEPGADGPRAELANVEELFIVCQSDLKELTFGVDSVKFIESEAERLLSMITDDPAAAAATGGEPLSDIYGSFRELGWDNLVKKFI